jgi:hypothetical protein
MKKIVLLIQLVLFSVALFGQNLEADEFTLKDSMVQYTNGTTTTLIIPQSDGTAKYKNVADPIDGKDAVNLDYVLGLPSSGFDSTDFNVVQGYLRFLTSGTPFNTVNLDVGYFAVGDLADYVPLAGAEVIYVTPDQLSDSLDVAVQQNFYRLELGSGTDVQDRIDDATYIPTGWVLTKSGLDLIITHNLGRWPFGVTVWMKTGVGDVRQQLYDTAAYGVITATDEDNIKISSLSLSSFEIVVEIALR